MKRPNKVVVITGGNRGIGLLVVEKLLMCDMIVIMGVRNPESSKKSVEEALGLALTKEKVYYEKCDTEDMASVREFAMKVQAKFTAIHVLINNGEKFSCLMSLTLIFCLLSWRYVHTLQKNQRWLRITNGDQLLGTLFTITSTNAASYCWIQR